MTCVGAAELPAIAAGIGSPAGQMEQRDLHGPRAVRSLDELAGIDPAVATRAVELPLEIYPADLAAEVVKDRAEGTAAYRPEVGVSRGFGPDSIVGKL